MVGNLVGPPEVARIRCIIVWDKGSPCTVAMAPWGLLHPPTHRSAAVCCQPPSEGCLSGSSQAWLCRRESAQHTARARSGEWHIRTHCIRGGMIQQREAAGSHRPCGSYSEGPQGPSPFEVWHVQGATLAPSNAVMPALHGRLVQLLVLCPVGLREQAAGAGVSNR